MKFQEICTRVLVLLLAISICGTAELAQALQTASPAQPANTQNTTETPAAQNPPATPADLPNAPSTDVAKPAGQTNVTPSVPTTVIFPGGDQATPAQQDQSQAGSTTRQQPLGTAAAEKGVTQGGAASRPAGNAIAGTKQRQSRSFLIKMGAIAAAGVALGTIYALSRGTSSVPPGSR
jgi:hypothetical protein